MSPTRTARTRRFLVLDVGGSHVEGDFSGGGPEFRFASGPKMTPGEMMRRLREPLEGQRFDGVAIGYPGVVRDNAVLREPFNLGHGWVGFDFGKAFGRPVRLLNDAAMQALGSYQGGRMLFLGLGTGLGSAMIVDGCVLPMELAHLPFKKGRTFEEYVGKAALARLGRKKWTKEVFRTVEVLSAALQPDEVVLGGGNAGLIRKFPAGVRAGDNQKAILGGIRLWQHPTEWDLPSARGARPARPAAPGRPARTPARG